MTVLAFLIAVWFILLFRPVSAFLLVVAAIVLAVASVPVLWETVVNHSEGLAMAVWLAVPITGILQLIRSEWRQD